MKKNKYSSEYIVNKKIIMALMLLFIQLIMNCQRGNSSEINKSDLVTENHAFFNQDKNNNERSNNIEGIVNRNNSIDQVLPDNMEDSTTQSLSRDPFLLFFLRNYPTLKIDISENLVIQRISYRDFEKKEINYGDDDPGTYWHSIYLFENGVFQGIENATTNDSAVLWRHISIDIIRNQNGSIGSINQYMTGTENLMQQDTYKKDSNIIVANDSLRRGTIFAVLVEEEQRLLYFGDYQRYNKAPNIPDMTIEFINDDIIITQYNFLLKKYTSRFYFINGILMKREYIDNYIETYTVSSGIGEIIITDIVGDLIECKFLERRINDAGYLEYEAVRNLSGIGYEYLFSKDTLR